jgi:hypothetical protein
MEPTMISLDRCQWCGVKIVYEKHRTGLLTMHELEDGSLDFLCPEIPKPENPS